jgi:hypothetical protein
VGHGSPIKAPKATSAFTQAAQTNREEAAQEKEMFQDSVSGAIIRPTTNRKRVVATFTRPSDTTAYTAGDVVGPITTPAVQQLSGAGRGNGATGRVVGAILETNLATVTNGTFRVHLFNATFTPEADNAAFASLHANRAAYQGYFDFNILVADSSSAAAAVAQLRNATDIDNGIPLDFICASGDSSLYAVIVALGAYTPASAQVIRLSLLIEQD